MGTWIITIKGHGAHHNDALDDANHLAARFVKKLQLNNHEISEAAFTLTNSDDSAVSSDDLLEEAKKQV